jgi:hypothetical protein
LARAAVERPEAHKETFNKAQTAAQNQAARHYKMHTEDIKHWMKL